MQPALIAVVAVLSVGGAGWTAYELTAAEPVRIDFRGLDCSQPLVPFATPDQEGAIAVAAHNKGEAGDLRVCIYDETKIKRADEVIELGAESNHGRVIGVPIGTYAVVMRIGGDDGGTATIGSVADLDRCPKQLHQVDVWFLGRERHLEGKRGSCTETGSADPATMGSLDSPILPGLGSDKSVGPGMAATGAGLLVGLPLIVWRRRDLQFLLLALFSRLQRSRLLDQPTRARIHDLVEHQPGIHGAAIAQELELGTGTAVHHLRVLVRERQLSRLRVFGRAHFFAYGRYSPDQMRLLCANRSASLQRVYRTIQREPGLSLSDVAQRSGYSLGQASKLARRLQREGLVAAQASGRATLWHPTPARLTV